MKSEISGFRICLVEDDFDVGGLLRINLEHDEALITQCYTASEAMEDVIWEEIDVVISDWMLPGISGVKLLRWIRDNYPSIRRILVSAANMKIIEEDEGPDLACDLFLEKPFSTSVIVRAVTGDA